MNQVYLHVLKPNEKRILTELQTATQNHTDWPKLDMTKAPSIHVAVMSEPFLSYVFNGKKTVESRFSINKIAPYGKAQTGDVVFMKAGPIIGCFTISWVKTFDLQEYPINEIAKEFGAQICGDEAFWRDKSTKHYATLMGITNIQRLTPVRITKFDRRAWMTLKNEVSIRLC